MFLIANDTPFWDRSARKYAGDPIADMTGYERNDRDRAREGEGRSLLHRHVRSGAARW